MTPNEKLARIKELESIISHKHMLVCGLILDGNTQAQAWKAVYPRVKKDATASQNCSVNLKNPETGMKEYIDLMSWKATATAAEKLGLDQYWVLSGLKQIAEADEDAKASDRRAAMVDVGKHLKMFGETVEHNVSDPLAEIMQQIADSRAGASPLPSGE